MAPEFEFADEAVSGTRPDRDGLQSMLEAARGRRFQVLYIENLSRLARESVISMPLLKELVHVCGVRVISVTEGIDSENESWDLLATILGIQHERFVKDLGKYVLRGQEGVLLEGVVGLEILLGRVVDHGRLVEVEHPQVGHVGQDAPDLPHLVGAPGGHDQFHQPPRARA